MLVPIIFIIALMLALATAMLENGLVAAKITLQTSVARYSDVAISDGVADFTAGLAAWVKQHGSSGPWPEGTSDSFTKTLCDPSVPVQTCPFSYTIHGTITAGSGSDPVAGPRDLATNLQTSVIGEGRVSAIVRATITAQNGMTFGTRTRFLTYRVLEAAPYAIVSGSRDMNVVAGSRTTAQGDSGGVAPETQPAPPDASSGDAGTTRDTRIHVQLTCSTVIANVKPFLNDQQAVGNDGLPWGISAGSAYETPCHQPASPADAFADKEWTNGNANASGWTQ